MQIREFKAQDIEAIKKCMIELQDFERTIESNRRKGAEMVDEYVAEMLNVCNSPKYKGKIWVAEDDGLICGFIYGFIHQDMIDKVPQMYFSDIVVLPQFRGKGIARELMKVLENYARELGLTKLSIDVLVQNQRAYEVYNAFGFSDNSIKMIKEI